MKKILSVLFLLILIFGGRVYAQDAPQTDTARDGATAEQTQSGDAYQFPVIQPTGMLFGGYRFVGVNGSPTADQYDYLHSSISLGGELRMYPFPHRLHLVLDFKNRKDYFGDLDYAYKDIVLFNVMNRTLYHNLYNVSLIGPAATVLPNGGTVAPTGTQGVYVKDAGQQYGVRWGMTSASLRFKTPDYPFHVFINGDVVDKKGTMQQRFLSGAASFSNLVKTSEARDIDWETKQLTIGTNAHLGPVEIQLSHGEKRFDPGDDSVLYDYYTAAPIRGEGIYAHNLVPKFKGSSNTLKIHTSYTGKIVASATFTDVHRDNEYSRAKADYFFGGGEVTWTAATNFAVFLRYRHKEIDVDNPSSVTITNLSNPTDINTFVVRPSISSITDTTSAIARYTPFSGLTLRGEYNFDRISRENYKAWDLPGKTRHHTASISADVRIMRNMNLRAGYSHKQTSNPAYNIDPDHSNEGHAALSWTPVQRITTFVSYSVAKEQRGDLNTVNSTAARNRDVTRDRAISAVTFLLNEEVSLTASYSYIHDKIRQDIVLGSQLEPYVPDTDLAQSYGLTMNYMPSDRINLNAGVNYTLSSGAFALTDPDLLQPISVANMSALRTKETDCSVSGEYEFRNGYSAGIRYRYIDFNDMLDNPWDYVQDGRVHILLLTLSKKW